MKRKEVLTAAGLVPVTPLRCTTCGLDVDNGKYYGWLGEDASLCRACAAEEGHPEALADAKQELADAFGLIDWKGVLLP